jgi:predicted SnoaL-like aldol condensation-catalyzing enzyme
MKLSQEEKNKQIVREAFEAVFNQRDLNAFEKYRSANYIRHSAHIPPGRGGLRNLVVSLAPKARYDSSIMMAEGDYDTF